MKQFPILIGYEGTAGPCPSSIPWDAIAPYDGQARQNHQQSLERLAERGGLSPMEAWLVMTGKTWQGETFTKEREKEACAFLDKIVRDRGELETKVRDLELQLSESLEDRKGLVKTLDLIVDEFNAGASAQHLASIAGASVQSYKIKNAAGAGYEPSSPEGGAPVAEKRDNV